MSFVSVCLGVVLLYPFGSVCYGMYYYVCSFQFV